MVEDVQESELATSSFLGAGYESCSPEGWSSMKENFGLQTLRLSSENEALEMVFSRRLPCFINSAGTFLLFCLGSGAYWPQYGVLILL